MVYFQRHLAPFVACLGFSAFTLVALPRPLTAQRRCTKGIPCGNTCIAANKVCHVGTVAGGAVKVDSTGRVISPVAKPAPVGTSPGDTTTLVGDSVWVASYADGVYFLAKCSAALDLAPANRRYFKTEEQAKVAGYRHSRTPGC